MKKIKIMSLLLFGLSMSMMAKTTVTPKYYSFAKTPPMGWNSWDAFGSSVTEKDILANTDYLAKNLLSHGWNYMTIDIQWYEPNAQKDQYKRGAPLEMDKYGRLLPAPNRFPMTKASRSWKPMADYVHSKGLKFGLHIMRGIPKQAVDSLNCPILGTNYHARDIVDKNNSCRWNQDMYGVDMTKPGAQEYYNSVYKLYASMGLDFIKVDDLAGKHPEIEGIRKAIDNCGRPIVLSVSMGSGANEGEHLQVNANMWRVSFDFWDNWSALYNQFQNLNAHQPYMGVGHWPDADMLPLGHLQTWLPNRYTKFTKDEQYTVMTLWSIARSPLIMGGNMPNNDAFTLSLMTNDEVLAVDQKSTNNKQLFAIHNEKAHQYGWVANVPASKDKYVALFNASPSPAPRQGRGGFGGGAPAAPGAQPAQPGQAASAALPATPAVAPAPVSLGDTIPAKVTVVFSDLGFTGKCTVRDLWAHKDLGTFEKEFSAVINSHGAGLYRIAPAK